MFIICILIIVVYLKWIYFLHCVFVLCLPILQERNGLEVHSGSGAMAFGGCTANDILPQNPFIISHRKLLSISSFQTAPALNIEIFSPPVVEVEYGIADKPTQGSDFLSISFSEYSSFL